MIICLSITKSLIFLSVDTDWSVYHMSSTICLSTKMYISINLCIIYTPTIIYNPSMSHMYLCITYNLSIIYVSSMCIAVSNLSFVIIYYQPYTYLTSFFYNVWSICTSIIYHLSFLYHLQSRKQP